MQQNPFTYFLYFVIIFLKNRILRRFEIVIGFSNAKVHPIYETLQTVSTSAEAFV